MRASLQSNGGFYSLLWNLDPKLVSLHNVYRCGTHCDVIVAINLPNIKKHFIAHFKVVTKHTWKWISFLEYIYSKNRFWENVLFSKKHIFVKQTRVINLIVSNTLEFSLTLFKSQSLK